MYSSPRSARTASLDWDLAEEDLFVSRGVTSFLGLKEQRKSYYLFK